MTHFDQVEDYDSVIPKHITRYFLAKKTNVILDAFCHSLNIKLPLHGLDLGCGTGDIVSNLSKKLPYARITGLDSSIQMLSHATRKYPEIEFVHGDMMKLPFPDEHFDFVIATNSLHHLKNHKEQFEVRDEVFRILKAKGVFILNEMNTRNPIVKAYLRHIFPLFREFERGDEIPLHKDVLEGFQIIDTRYYTFIPDFLWSGLMFRVARRVDRVLDRSPLSSLGCHITIEAIKL